MPRARHIAADDAHAPAEIVKARIPKRRRLTRYRMTLRCMSYHARHDEFIGITSLANTRAVSRYRALRLDAVDVKRLI